MKRRRPLRAIAVVLLLGAAGTVAAPAADPPRVLFVALDAVPYELVADLASPDGTAEPIFQGLAGPVPLVSTFPSTTSVALAGILEPFHLDESPGYEARFFDWDERRVRGGTLFSYSKIDFPWHDFFDWQPSGLIGTLLADVRPVRRGLDQIDTAVDAFFASRKQRFFVYIGATDSIGHLKGPRVQATALRKLDRSLARARAAHPGQPFHVVLFSDHGLAGGSPLDNVWPGVKARLERAGFHLASRLEGPRDVVFTPFGLVSSFEIYVPKRLAAETARLAASVDGVDLCVSRAGDRFRIDSRRGVAFFAHHGPPGAGSWTYQPAGGDPLGYRPIVERLRRDLGDGDGFWSDRSWFLATRDAAYPDALYRLAYSFGSVDNPATVLCSVADGYMFGASRTEWAASTFKGRLRWTHGALLREASYGFLMSDLPGFRPNGPVRFDHALEFAAAPPERPEVRAGLPAPRRPIAGSSHGRARYDQHKRPPIP